MTRQRTPVTPPPAPAAAAAVAPAETKPVEPVKTPEVAKPAADAEKPAAAKAEDTAHAAKGKDATGRDTLSVDFPDEDVRNILRNVADLFELNIIMPETLQGKTTIKLRVPYWVAGPATVEDAAVTARPTRAAATIVVVRRLMNELRGVRRVRTVVTPSPGIDAWQ